MSSLAFPGDEPPPPYSESSNDSVPFHQPLQQQQPAANSSASRPSSSSQPVQLSTFAICIKPNTRRTEIPYPSNWASRHHVSSQDWAMFVARLIPDSMIEDLGRDSKCLSYERKQAIEVTIRQWNETYFEPRGVKIIFEEYSPSRQHQSQSEASSSNALPSAGRHSTSRPNSSTGYQPQQHPPQTFPEQLPPRPSGQPPRKFLSTRQKLTNKLKQVAQENDITYSPQHFRIGHVLTVDANKIQIGRLNLDERGVQYGGRPLGPQFPPGYLDQAVMPQNRPPQTYSQGHHGTNNGSGYYHGGPPQPHGYYSHSGPSPSDGIPHPGSWDSPSPSYQSGSYGPAYHGQASQSQSNDFAPPMGPPPNQARATASW